MNRINLIFQWAFCHEKGPRSLPRWLYYEKVKKVGNFLYSRDFKSWPIVSSSVSVVSKTKRRFRFGFGKSHNYNSGEKAQLIHNGDLLCYWAVVLRLKCLWDDAAKRSHVHLYKAPNELSWAYMRVWKWCDLQADLMQLCEQWWLTIGASKILGKLRMLVIHDHSVQTILI